MYWGVAKAQDCDCKITPYKPNPPCFKICVMKMLLESSKEKLQSTVKLSSALSIKVKNILLDKSDSTTVLDTLEKRLSKEEYKTLLNKLELFNNKKTTLVNPQ